jgi:hypothetical protein
MIVSVDRGVMIINARTGNVLLTAATSSACLWPPETAGAGDES